MDYITALVGITGLLLLALKRYEILGWWLLILASLGWMYVGCAQDLYGLMLSSGLYLIVQIVGLIKGRRT